MSHKGQLEIAIVGGGIVGVILAMGLLKRDIKVKLYEQSGSFREIGAGIAFTANALQCMKILDPAIVDAVDAIATPNGEDVDNPNDYLRYHDGYHWDPADPEGTDDKLLFTLYSGYKGFQGCHRAHLLVELVRHIPQDVVEFHRRFTGYTNPGSGEKLRLHFEDGSMAEADAIIGCDGIKSKVRQLMLGPQSPASYPHFSHKVAFRALVPMEQAEPVLGPFKAHNQHMHQGPGAHILHFPVAEHKVLNVVAFADEPGDWPLGDANGVHNMVAPAGRAELEAVFRGWGPTVARIVQLLPDDMDKWAIFDTYDHPAPGYADGRVCLAGDAAHASSPHHGAGAGIGVEDALALCTLLDRAGRVLAGPRGPPRPGHVAAVVEAAFRAYDEARRERSQWLVQSSREVCDIYEWKWPGTEQVWERCEAEITARSHKLWYFDIDGMLETASRSFDASPAIEAITHST